MPSLNDMMHNVCYPNVHHDLSETESLVTSKYEGDTNDVSENFESSHIVSAYEVDCEECSHVTQGDEIIEVNVLQEEVVPYIREDIYCSQHAKNDVYSWKWL